MLRVQVREYAVKPAEWSGMSVPICEVRMMTRSGPLGKFDAMHEAIGAS
jgi:hypothetical protein